MHAKPSQKFVSPQPVDPEFFSGNLNRRFLDNERNIDEAGAFQPSFPRNGSISSQFVGPDARPISSSTSPLYGGAGPFIPGGIFRVAMVVTREGAPATFMRRPFANTPGSAVMPGVVLRAG